MPLKPRTMETTDGQSAQSQREAGGSPKIALKMEGKTVFVDIGGLWAVEAHGNYVLLVTPPDSYLLRESVSTVADKLERHGFVRIHRSTIVNASLVEEIRNSPSGRLSIRLKGGEKEYYVSRKYKRSLKSLATCWI
jgi:two-component system, LytTR family, response regulator